jgi:hypothetical protein
LRLCLDLLPPLALGTVCSFKVFSYSPSAIRPLLLADIRRPIFDL